MMPIKTNLELEDAQCERLENAPSFDAGKMLDQENTARLVLGSQIYVLRKTRQDKLLLTK